MWLRIESPYAAPLTDSPVSGYLQAEKWLGRYVSPCSVRRSGSPMSEPWPGLIDD